MPGGVGESPGGVGESPGSPAPGGVGDPPASAPGGGDAAVPVHEVEPTSDTSNLPEPNLLSVIGGLLALGIAGGGSAAVSFQGAAQAQARIDAARAEFFGPRA
ncbi:hypothetical protein [Nocardia salmonicida]|uniref:hypothetical protein n=1 Tax=Nocardia salmonicida TaxID=53431 RepID=UPI0033F681AA